MALRKPVTSRASPVVVCLLVLGLTGWLAPGVVCGAEVPEIAVQAGATELFTGESLDYVVEIRNVREPTPPDLSAFSDDFQVVANGDESRNQSSTFILNGRVSQRNTFSHVYRYRLTPRREGDLQIPSPKVTVDGTTYRGETLQLRVSPPEEQDLVIPELIVERSRVYPTQSFDVLLRILVRPLPDSSQRDPLSPLSRQPPKIEVNLVDLPQGLSGDDKVQWLQQMLAEDRVGFSLNDVTLRGSLFLEGPRVAQFDLHRGRVSRPDQEGESVQYHVYELGRRITADTPGVYRFGPAVVKGSFVSGMKSRNYTAQRLVAIAPAVTVEVRQVPEPRPVNYCGGIGAYQLTATANPARLRVGDPLTLTLEFRPLQGGGSLDLLAAPDLTSSAELVADFEVVDRNPTGRIEGETKRFDYALRPKRSGVDLPALTTTVFDPESEEFVALQTRPIALEVDEAQRIGSGDLIGPTSGASGREIRSQESGIYQNVSDPEEWRDERVSIAWIAGGSSAAWLAAGALGMGLAIRRRSAEDLVGRRRRGARRLAEDRLKQARAALRDGRGSEALRLIRGALLGLTADLRNLVADGLTAGDVATVLADRSLPAGLRDEVLRLLRGLEAAEYGGGDTHQAAEMLQQAGTIVPALVRALERES